MNPERSLTCILSAAACIFRTCRLASQTLATDWSRVAATFFLTRYCFAALWRTSAAARSFWKRRRRSLALIQVWMVVMASIFCLKAMRRRKLRKALWSRMTDRWALVRSAKALSVFSLAWRWAYKNRNYGYWIFSTVMIWDLKDRWLSDHSETSLSYLKKNDVILEYHKRKCITTWKRRS